MAEEEKLSKKPRRRHIFQKVLAFFISLSVLVLAGVWFLPSILPLETIRLRLEEDLSEAFGRPVSIESIEFSLVERTITFHNVIVKSPPEALHPMTAPLGKVTAHVELKPLLKRVLNLRLDISELGPSVREMPGRLTVIIPDFTRKPYPERSYVSFEVDRFRDFPLADLVTGIGRPLLSGGCKLDLILARKEPQGFDVSGSGSLNGLSLRWEDFDMPALLFDGSFSFSHGRIESKSMGVELGKSKVIISGLVEDLRTEKPHVDLEILSPHVETVELRQIFASIQGPPATEESSTPIAALETLNPAEQALAERVTTNAVLDLRLVIEELTLSQGAAQEVNVLLKGREGLYQLDEARALLYGGSVDLSGSTLDLTQEVPKYHLRLECERLSSNPPIQEKCVTPYVPQITFQGTFSCRMEADGLLYADEEAFQQALVGKGQAVLTNGILSGPAQRDYVLKLFPGLDTSRHEFETLKAEFKMKEGIKYADMLLYGKGYDIYLEGQTSPEGYMRYIIGVNFSGKGSSEITPEAQTKEASRIAILKYTARNESGVVTDEHVKFFSLSYILTDILNKGIIGKVKVGLLGEDFIKESLKKINPLSARSMEKTREEFLQEEEGGAAPQERPKKRGIIGTTFDIVVSVPKVAVKGVFGIANLLNPLRWFKQKPPPEK